MGCNASITNDTIQQITNQQIQQIKDETISPLSFQFFLNNFYFVSRYEKFYTDLPLNKQLFVLEKVGPLTKEECSVVVENYCKNAESEEGLASSLQQISRKMICQTRVQGSDEDVFIPVGLDQKLWKSIMQKRYETKYGNFKMNKSFVDWSDNEITKDRDIFLGEMQTQLQKVDHTKDLSLLIQNNTIDTLWTKNINQEENPEIKKNVSKPFFWEMNIHDAAFKGKKSSVEYNLSLIPQMLNLPDYKDNTPVHYAAMGNQKSMLIYLKDIGADFTLLNSDGLLPIHLISNKSVITTMKDLGLDINERNAAGESLLDIKTRFFDKSMIKSMLALGINILEPNPKGAFWIQTALHKEYYAGAMKEEKFVNFVRKQLISNKNAPWNDDPIYQEIIARKDRTHVKEDQEDLHLSVLAQDIPRINVLLALGTKADEVLETGSTNLYICAKKGLTESARVLSQNYCNTNFTNSQHENTFWVAAINEHFDTALVLRDNGADMNMVDVNNETILHNVYRRKITNIFNFLLEAGASPNVKNGKCQTVTFIAFLNRDDEIAEMLQDKYKGDINAQDHKFNSLVHLAFIQKDFQRIEYLSKRHINMDLKNNKGHSILMMAFFDEVNFQTWDFLLEMGSNISTTDYQNNSMLHHLFFMKEAREDVFRYLMNKQIDYDIENNHGQFAISIAIEMSHDKFGFELLDLNCKILDQKSIHEPIVEALKRGSQQWFEALVDHGADGMNEKVGVISRYINSGFFDYKVFKKIPRMNIFLEAPLQMAIYKQFEQCADDLWNMANTNSLKVKIANNIDAYGRVLISAAIIMKNERFVDLLLNDKYDCETPDNDGRTPFIHACMVDVLKWMGKLFLIIPLSNANMKDNDNCSALTYAANNKRREFCDHLFIKGIDIYNIKTDYNGIIGHYRDLMERYNKAKNEAYENYNDAKSALYEVERDVEEVERRRRELQSQISSLNSQIRSFNNNEYSSRSEYDRLQSEIRDCERSERKYIEFAQRIERDYIHAKDVCDYYERCYDAIISMTRKDILNDIGHIESLACRSREIGKREFHIDWAAIGALALGVLLFL
ncbi:Transient receptor putative cation channel subfamily A member 1 [Tritrichomonas musculus]|uniref:Transient receptor putative cation channel subfamily A member 1 n=1 Tax=Tritrichomonas musculus TaxID=1915356 RepID=A0ABR2H977_9EUKA